MDLFHASPISGLISAESKERQFRHPRIRSNFETKAVSNAKHQGAAPALYLVLLSILGE